MKVKKHSKLIVAVQVMLAIGLLSSCGTKQEEKTVFPIRVSTETLIPDNALGTQRYVGEIIAEHTTAVSFSVGGLVQRMLVEEGQHITKGQTLAIIDDTQLRNALAASEAILNQAQDAYNRMKVLHERGSLSDMDWVGVESKLTSAKSNYAMAKKNANDAILTAPFTGIIGKKTVEAGTTVAPNQPVCTLLDIRNVKVKVNMPEKDMGLIHKQSCENVQIHVDAVGGEAIPCTGIQKGVQGNQTSRTYDVFFFAKNVDARLLPGMVADVRLTTAHNEAGHSLTVPITAVQRRSKNDLFIWIMQNDKAVCKNVTIGQASSGRIEITSGLSQGDKVIVKGYQKLSENMQVTDK